MLHQRLVPSENTLTYKNASPIWSCLASLTLDLLGLPSVFFTLENFMSTVKKDVLLAVSLGLGISWPSWNSVTAALPLLLPATV